ncbi:hypothetical protein RND71_022080 [Anisodus tanguticus]|uniref:NB-ARC domain containing protein n=1 Tax=Anisodus tanguticus TaxID=243964 RepID=A0AAE1RXU2_9SOLA|nr:hypothetical protein RND71_022080 [Anisodus tanguticus]
MLCRFWGWFTWLWRFKNGGVRFGVFMRWLGFSLRVFLLKRKGLRVAKFSFNVKSQNSPSCKKNEIEIVEVVKNNGDRVVDTCVRDDTLNATVTVNRALARVSQDLTLGAKAGDLVDPSNPKQLPIPGVLNGKYSGQANRVQQRGENLDQVFEFGGSDDRGGWTEVPSKNISSGTTPTIHISNPEIARIIEEHQATMLSTPSISQANSTNDLIVSKEKQGETSAHQWADLVEEEEHITSPPRSKLSPQAPVFVSSSKILAITTKDMGVLTKSHEPKAVVSGRNPSITYDIDLGDDMFDENDEDDMLDISFDKVAKDGDLSPRQQRSGSNKSKNKAHGRQDSWDGKVTEEFVPKHLPMRLEKQNHMTVSTTSTRSNKCKK